MSRAASPFAALALALALGGCSASRPPAELSGLWSAGPAACAAGVGVRFGGEAIEVVYEHQAETLFASPRYDVERNGADFRVRITYQLPRLVGGVRSVGAHGVIVLVRTADGGISPALHNLVDARTGATRLRISDDPAVTALTLKPCGAAHPFREELRGRTRT